MLALSGWEIFVVYIPTILFFVIFLWQLIAGLRRGLRKSTILIYQYDDCNGRYFNYFLYFLWK